MGPPGTGKTRTLIGLVQQHLHDNPSNAALFCSHTKSAAQTAVGRWAGSLDRLEICTIHSMAFGALRLSRAQTVDEARLGEFSKQFGMDMDDGGDAKAYLEIIDRARATDQSMRVAYQVSQRPGTADHFMAFATSYFKWKKQFGYVDFSDMLMLYCERVKVPSRYTLMVVDEAQDLTLQHWRVVEHFMDLNPKCQIIVAGDDDQCIYSHAGAVALGADQFAKLHDAEVTILGQSYRVPRAVHALASRIVARIDDRVAKTYLPRDFEGKVQNWGEFQWGHSVGRADRDTIVLYADKFVRRDDVEPALMDAGVPFTALSGFPAPLDTQVGRAIRLAHQGPFNQRPFSDDERRVLRRGLSDKGRTVLDVVGVDALCERLRKLDTSLVGKIHWSHLDYFKRVDFRKPINVKISTIHGAKGGEAQDVHLICGQSPSAIDQSLLDPDSKHRLFYVGVTRASERLFLYGGDNAYEMPR